MKEITWRGCNKRVKLQPLLTLVIVTVIIIHYFDTTMTNRLYAFAAFALGVTALTTGALFGLVPNAQADTETTPPNTETAPKTHLPRPGMGREEMLKEKAGILGLSVSDLEEKLHEGQTFITIAADQGIDEETFHKKIEEARTAHLNALVADGTITQAQMDARLARMKARATEEKTCDGLGMPRRFLGAHTFKTARGQQ